MATIHSSHTANCVQNYNFVNISCGHGASVKKKFVILVRICWALYLHTYIHIYFCYTYVFVCVYVNCFIIFSKHHLRSQS